MTPLIAIDGRTRNPTAHQGQDLFAYHMLGQKRDGKFLDIGCADPFIGSNSAWLESLGWSGVCVDCNPYDFSVRSAMYVVGDAVKLDYSSYRSDYLSIDVDKDSYLALVRVFECGVQPQVITIEHDAYDEGSNATLQVQQRSYLSLIKGYRLVASLTFEDCGRICPWEDWWVRGDQSHKLWQTMMTVPTL